MPASEYNMRLEGTWDEPAQTVAAQGRAREQPGSTAP